MELKIQLEGKLVQKIKLDKNQNLTQIRQYLLDIILVPFIFLDSDEKEISKKS